MSEGGVGDGMYAAALALQLPPSLCGASTEPWAGSLVVHRGVFRAGAAHAVCAGRGLSAQHSHRGLG